MQHFKANEQKTCPFCGGSNVKNNGHKRGVPMYKCKSCGKQFAGGMRLDNVSLWHSYIREVRTFSQLAIQYGCSERTIRRRISSVFDRLVPFFPRESIVITDTTYWGRGFGLMLFQDARTGKVLHRKYLKNETNALYLEGLDFLRSNGTHIAAVVCDGHTGLLKSIAECPVQMCQFHFFQIIRRKLTSSPRLRCGQELLDLCKRIFYVKSGEFIKDFESWETHREEFLNERTRQADGGTAYTHRRLRLARKSVRTHLPWLFTFERYPLLGIPNTTGKIEGVNSQIKKQTKAHSGQKLANKKRIIDAFLNGIGTAE